MTTHDQSTRVFLSRVSSEFKSYRLKIANQLGALKGEPFEINVQEDFRQGGDTLFAHLAGPIRDSNSDGARNIDSVRVCGTIPLLRND